MSTSGKSALAKVGRRNMTEDSAAEVGARFIKDLVEKALKDAGVEEPPSIKVSLVNGGELVIVGPDDPQLKRPASDVKVTDGKPAIKVGGSAKGGS